MLDLSFIHAAPFLRTNHTYCVGSCDWFLRRTTETTDDR